MTKDDDKLIWRALTEQASPGFTEFRSDDKTHDREGEEPGPMVALNPRDEEEEGGCPNLDKLISQAAANEDAEVEDLNIMMKLIHFQKLKMKPLYND